MRMAHCPLYEEPLPRSDSDIENIQNKEKVDRSTLQDFCMHMSDEEILSNRNMVPTWGLTKEAARNLLDAKRAKKKDLTTKPTGV